MSTIAFELVAPEKLLLSRAVGMVTVPGEEGDFGVLPGHAPLVSTLRQGVIEIQDDGVVTDRFFVTGGFAEVSPERCTVLAEQAVSLADLDRSALEADIKKAQDELVVADSDEAKARIHARVALTEAKLAALSQTAAH